MSLQDDARERMVRAVVNIPWEKLGDSLMTALSDDAVVAWVLSQACEHIGWRSPLPGRDLFHVGSDPRPHGYDYLFTPRSAGVAARLAEADRG